MDLTLQNFQAWGEASVCVKGLTVIVGPSNRGKSSFVRALRGILRNDVSERRIRKGTKSVTVSLVSHGRPALEVKRTKAETTYTVGDETYTKLGGKVPPPVEAMNVGSVRVGDYALDPIFAGQFDGQFLLSAPPAEVTAVLNAFASTDRLDRGRKVLATRINGLNSQAQALATFISKGEEDLAAADDLIEASTPAVQQAVNLAGRVSKMQQALEAAKAAGRLLQERASLASRLKQVEVVGERLNQSLATLKSATRANRAYCASVELGRLESHRAAVAEVEDRRTTFLMASNRALSASAAAEATRASRDLTARARVVDALDQEKQRCLTAWATLRPSSVLQGVTASMTSQHAQLEALEALRGPLNHALITWKARVRTVALQSLDVEGPKALAAQVGDLGQGLPQLHQTFKALGIIQNLQDLRSRADGFEDVGPDLQALESERIHLEDQLNRVAVTCPKCHHQFNPKESTHGC